MRVLLTRAAADAASTAAALVRLGHPAVLAPVTAIRRTGAARPAGRFDGIAATSHHAFATGEADFDPCCPVFAVGQRTAEAARAAGCRDVRVGTAGAASLADLVRLTLPRPARLLYRAGRDRKPTLEHALRAAGYEVVTVEVYAAEPVERWPEVAVAALQAGQVEAALHFSRRSAEIALTLATAAGVDDAFLALHHLCLSNDVAAPLLARPAPDVAVADRPDEDSLFDLLTPGPR